MTLIFVIVRIIIIIIVVILTAVVTQQILESRGVIGPDSVLPDFLVDRSG